MKYYAVQVPENLASVFEENFAAFLFPEAKLKEVVLDEIDEDTFETVTVLT